MARDQTRYWAPTYIHGYPPGRLNKQNALVVGVLADDATPWLAVNAEDAIRAEVHRVRLELNTVLQARTGAIEYIPKIIPIDIQATVLLETKFGGADDGTAVVVERYIDQNQTRILKNIPGGFVRLRIECTEESGMREDSIRMFLNISRLGGR